jgi:hypothetical protein
VFRFCIENSIEEKVIEKAYKKLRLDALVIQQGRLTENAGTKVGWVGLPVNVWHVICQYECVLMRAGMVCRSCVMDRLHGYGCGPVSGGACLLAECLISLPQQQQAGDTCARAAELGPFA